jgi:dihydrofolate synthase/folylpolyglutamate synthase
VPEDAIRAGVGRAAWAARLQRLHGKLADLVPSGWELWLDGGHNEGAAAVLATVLDGWRDRPLHLVVGMKQSKNAAAFLAPLIPRATTLWAVAEPRQHLAWPVETIVAASSGIARPGPTVAAALDQISHDAATSAVPARVLICGSLYLAGEVLRADGTIPD